MRKYYVAGPMRGIREFNFPAFMDAADQLRAEGHEVFNPAERDEEVGFDAKGLAGTVEEMAEYNFDLREALGADTAYICAHATHIWMLPGWGRSTGATAERALAIALGLVVEGAPA